MNSKWIGNLREKIRHHIKTETYKVTEHAIKRQHLRAVELPDVLEVLLQGVHEKEKTLFSTKLQTWNYAIRGKTVDGREMRVIIAFEEDMIISKQVVTFFGFGLISQQFS